MLSTNDYCRHDQPLGAAVVVDRSDGLQGVVARFINIGDIVVRRGLNTLTKIDWLSSSHPENP